MEKLKKLLNPGKEHEDEVLYGSGEDHVLAGTQGPQTHGQGSQVGSNDITGNDPRSSATDPALSSDYGADKGRHLETGGPSVATGGEDQYLSSSPRGVIDEASTTASIISGVPGKDQSSSVTRPSGTNDALDVNKPLPREPTGTGLTNPDGSSAAPHSSILANKVDPRVDSDRDRSLGIGHDKVTGSGLTGNTLPDRTVGSLEDDTYSKPTDSTIGRDAALGAGVGAGVGAGTAAVLHHKRDQDDLRSGSGRSFPLTDNSDTSAQSAGLSGITGGATAGPHSSSLANKADPRVDSDLDGSRTAGSAGYGSETGPTARAIPQDLSGQDPHTGFRSDTGILPASQTSVAGHGPESWKHDHASHGHEFVGDPCDHNGAEGKPLFTKGPHVTDTANLLDPHVNPTVTLPSESTTTSSDRELGLKPESRDPHGREVPELESATHSGDHHGRETAVSEPISQGDNHHGRDAALVGGLGAAGAAAYSSSRDDTRPAENTSDTTGPHRSKLLNKLDPRVHSGSTGSERPATTAETSALIGSSRPGSSSHMPTTTEVGTGPDHSRDAGAGAGIVGAGGVAGHESEKHPKDFEPSAATTSTSGIGSSDTSGIDTKGDYGHDVTSVATGGLGSHETESYPREDKDRGLSSRFLGGHHDKLKEPTGSGHSETTVPPTTTDAVGTEPESGSGHHYIRDAGLASAGVGGGLAAYETQKIHGRAEPGTTTTESSTYPPSDYGDGGRIADTYAGRDSAPVSGGVGTGPGTDDGAEFSKREAEKLAEAREKEFQKEQKAIHKEHVKHEKAIEKEEKKQEKEEKKHEKELAKEEKKHHDDGKKHGGILGIFHREKTDKPDESNVRGQDPHGSYQETEAVTGVTAAGATAAGVGTGVEHEKDKHEPNKLHKDPPAGYYESKGYQPPITGDGSQLAEGSNENSTGYQRAATGDVYPKVPGGTIIDPQTGLPVDLRKGTGEGGTDSGTMPGFNSHEADTSGLDRSRDINQL